MLNVLRHYLPLRKAILMASETVILTAIVLAGMSAHLWSPNAATQEDIFWHSLDFEQAYWRCFFSALMVTVITQVTLSFNELYDFRVSSSRYDRALRFTGSAGSAILIVVGGVALAKLWGIERLLDFPGLPLLQAIVLLTTTLVVGFTLLYFWRQIFHSILRRTHFDERILVLGSGPLADRLLDDIDRRPASGYQVVGRVREVPPGARDEASPEPLRATDKDAPSAADEALASELSAVTNPWRSTSPGTAALGSGALRLATSPAGLAPEVPLSEPLHELAERLRVDEVVVAFQERRGALPTDELLRCRLEGIAVIEAEAFYERLTGKIPAEAMRPSYLIFNPGFRQHPINEAAKRVLDIVVALVSLLLLWPFMLATALAVRLDSPGPILYRQVRTGRNGEPFTVLKFRSMRQDAEKASGPVWAAEDDPRITRVGSFMRRTRLDELPQLFNVLGGSMSMVGPRPERPMFVEDLATKLAYYHQRHVVKPGISGWAQINYPYGNTLEDALQKLQYDLFYIKYQSSLFDVSILFNTLKTVLLRKGT